MRDVLPRIPVQQRPALGWAGVASILTLSLGGCSFFEKISSPSSAPKGATVEVKTCDGDDTIPVEVTASSNKDGQEGVRIMRNRDWKDAIGKLSSAIAAGADKVDHAAYFARGICHEMLGQLDEAESDFKAANRATTKQDATYQLAVDRIDCKKKRR